MMVRIIDTKRIIISIKANPGFFRPKNIIDHKTLNRSCIAKTERANFFLLESALLFTYTKKAAVPIRANRITHTGPKIQFGGLNLGLLKLPYQFETEEIVKKEPITPASSQIPIAIINFK